MEEVICINNNCNEKIYVKGDRLGNYVSVLESGYIILQDGTFVILSENHGESLTDFYFLYHSNLVKTNNFTTFDAIPKLAKDGFIIFLGTKRNKIQKNSSDFGFAIIYFPESLTDEQKISCRKLLDTNYQILNPDLKKLNIEYGCGDNIRVEYTEEEVNKMLQVRTKKI